MYIALHTTNQRICFLDAFFVSVFCVLLFVTGVVLFKWSTTIKSHTPIKLQQFKANIPVHFCIPPKVQNNLLYWLNQSCTVQNHHQWIQNPSFKKHMANVEIVVTKGSEERLFCHHENIQHNPHPLLKQQRLKYLHLPPHLIPKLSNLPILLQLRRSLLPPPLPLLSNLKSRPRTRKRNLNCSNCF